MACGRSLDRLRHTPRAPLLLLAAIVLSGCWGRSRAPEELAYRPALARLSRDTGYAACREGVAPNGPPGSAGSVLRPWICSPRPEPDSAVFQVLLASNAMSADSASAELHHEALSALLWQSSVELERAVQALAIASVASGGDARVLSDLAAAHLAVALERRRPGEILSAVVAAGDALRQAPDYPPALFNRALALELLGLTTPAGEAWREYLARDGSSAWSAEARERLAALQRARPPETWQREARPALDGLLDGSAESEAIDRLVAAHPQSARDYLQKEWLPAWASVADPQRAAVRLRAAAALAASLERVTGDALSRRELELLGRLRGPSLLQAREAHRLLDQGRRSLYGEWDLQRARSSLVEAQALFEVVGSEEALWARFYLALTDYYEQAHAGALERLEALTPEAAAASPVLAGRVDWVKGLVGSGRGDLQFALDHYRAALGRFAEVGERENEAVLHSYLAHSRSELGPRDAWWSEAYQALLGLQEVASPMHRYAIFETLVMNLRRDGDEAGALVLADEQVRAALLAGGAPLRQSAHMRRAAIHRSLGEETDALADLAAARAAALEIEDPALRRRVEADQELLAAELGADSDPVAAIELASRALERYRSTEFSMLEPRALAARGRAQAALGQPQEAFSDFQAELSLLERRRRSFEDELARATFQKQMAEAFDRAVRLLAMELDRPREAMRLADEARAWPHPVLAMSPRGESMGDDRGPPARTLIVRYAVLGEDLCLWSQGAGEPLRQYCETGVLGEIERSAYGLIAGLSRHAATDEALGEDARLLYELLVSPYAASLAGVDRLVVIADGPVALVPFAALRGGDRLLIEDYEIAFATSAQGWLARDGAESELPHTPAMAVWASPRAGDPSLPPLPRSEEEARAVASDYAEGWVAEGGRLGRQGFLDELRRVAVLHFAGHAVDTRGTGDLQLVLEAGAQPTVVAAEDLQHLRAPGLRLVFLSACRSTGLGPEALPGPLGLLARSFLEIGADAVVGSAWDISDTGAFEMAHRFHAAYARGVPSAAALRAAQLELLAEGRAGEWALYRSYVG